MYFSHEIAYRTIDYFARIFFGIQGGKNPGALPRFTGVQPFPESVILTAMCQSCIQRPPVKANGSAFQHTWCFIAHHDSVMKIRMVNENQRIVPASEKRPDVFVARIILNIRSLCVSPHGTFEAFNIQRFKFLSPSFLYF